MMLVFWLQVGWQGRWAEIRRFFRGTNRQLTVAVGSGGVAALAIYLAVAIWAESDRPWMATGMVLQGLATLLMLVILGCQMNRSDRDETQRSQLLSDLTASDPLKRLVAVRLLTGWGMNDPELGIRDYFRLMLSREREPIVREAILDSLQALERSPMNQPLNIPTDLKHSVEVHRS